MALISETVRIVAVTTDNTVGGPMPGMMQPGAPAPAPQGTVTFEFVNGGGRFSRAVPQADLHLYAAGSDEPLTIG